MQICVSEVFTFYVVSLKHPLFFPVNGPVYKKDQVLKMGNILLSGSIAWVLHYPIILGYSPFYHFLCFLGLPRLHFETVGMINNRIFSRLLTRMANSGCYSVRNSAGLFVCRASGRQLTNSSLSIKVYFYRSTLGSNSWLYELLKWLIVSEPDDWNGNFLQNLFLAVHHDSFPL